MTSDVMPALKAVCSWCGKLIREGVEPVTHGLCGFCADRLMADIRKHREDR